MTSHTTTGTTAVAPTRASRYGKQLVSHLGRRTLGVWNKDTATGTLDMNEGAAHVEFVCTPDAPLITVTAAGSDLATYEDIVGRSGSVSATT